MGGKLGRLALRRGQHEDAPLIGERLDNGKPLIHLRCEFRQHAARWQHVDPRGFAACIKAPCLRATGCGGDRE